MVKRLLLRRIDLAVIWAIFGPSTLLLACGAGTSTSTDAGIEDRGRGDSSADAEVARDAEAVDVLDATIEDTGPAGEDASATDATRPDTGSADTGAGDVGPADVGSCTCSYGFHQQCAEDEVCLGYYSDPSCQHAEPPGGAINGGCTEASAAGGASCDAQCMPALEATSPCADAPRGIFSHAVGAWASAMQHASLDRTGTSTAPEAMDREYIRRAQYAAGSHQTCGDYIQWTMLGLLALCRGDDAIIPPRTGRWHGITEWFFRYVPEQDSCRVEAGNKCLQALYQSSDERRVAVDAVDLIPESCPEALPYGSPCGGLDREAAQRCLRNRVASSIEIMLRP